MRGRESPRSITQSASHCGRVNWPPLDANKGKQKRSPRMTLSKILKAVNLPLRICRATAQKNEMANATQAFGTRMAMDAEKSAPSHGEHITKATREATAIPLRSPCRPPSKKPRIWRMPPGSDTRDDSEGPPCAHSKCGGEKCNAQKSCRTHVFSFQKNGGASFSAGTTRIPQPRFLSLMLSQR